MALTKSVASVDDWTSVALASMAEGATVDLSACYDAMLHIVHALAGTTAHLGTEIIVQVSANTTGDEDWVDLCRFVAGVKTAFKSDFAADEAVGQTVLSVTNPATGNLDHLFKWILLLDATVVNSEIAYLIAQSGDAGDTITVQDAITVAKTSANSDVYTCDGAGVSAVDIFNVQLPASINRCRVLYNNGYGATGSTVLVSCRISKVTAL